MPAGGRCCHSSLGLTSKSAPWMAALPVSQPSVLRMAGTPRSQPCTPTGWLRTRHASHPYFAWLQLKHPGHSALPARAILAAFQPVQPSSGRWLRWLCPSHPPGRKMAVIQPSQPSAGGWLSRIRPSLLAAPDTSAGGSTLAARATTPLFWMAGVVISQPSTKNKIALGVGTPWSGSRKLWASKFLRRSRGPVPCGIDPIKCSSAQVLK